MVKCTRIRCFSQAISIVILSYCHIVILSKSFSISKQTMNDIQLSENFKLSEFTASETARRRKINNDAPESVIENLRNLCQNVVYYMKKN